MIEICLTHFLIFTFLFQSTLVTLQFYSDSLTNVFYKTLIVLIMCLERMLSCLKKEPIYTFVEFWPYDFRKNKSVFETFLFI